MGEWRTIVCAVDFSEASRRALEEAAALVKRVGALLTVMHVEPGPSGPPAPFAPPPRPAHRDPQAAATLRAWARSAEDALGQPVEMVLVSGRPGTEIVRVAEAGGYDAIFIGTHGRTGIVRAVLGSVAEQVVREARIPVVIVRGGG